LKANLRDFRLSIRLRRFFWSLLGFFFCFRGALFLVSSISYFFLAKLA